MSPYRLAEQTSGFANRCPKAVMPLPTHAVGKASMNKRLFLREPTGSANGGNVRVCGMAALWENPEWTPFHRESRAAGIRTARNWQPANDPRW